MHNKYTLVVLAAGIGSRYGGTKQLDEVSASGASIMEFSIYDAIKAGFTNIVFVLRKDILKEVKIDFDSKLKGKATVAYVSQETDNIPQKYQNSTRLKPWGTGQALLVAKTHIQEEFCVINADDFYGFDAFKAMYRFLKNNKDRQQYAMVGYPVQNTLSANGSVSRGQCYVDSDLQLLKITERTAIVQKEDVISYKTAAGKEELLSRDTLVSMNFWGFYPEFFSYLEAAFEQFLSVNSNSLTTEFYLPSVIDELLQKQRVRVRVLETSANWMGVTYQEDKELVVRKIKDFIAQGAYPENLWR